jgi:hypothetical protein
MTNDLATLLVWAIVFGTGLGLLLLRQIRDALRGTSVSTYQIAQAASMSPPAHPPAEWGIVEEGDQIQIRSEPLKASALYRVTAVHENNSITVEPWPTTPTTEASA